MSEFPAGFKHKLKLSLTSNSEEVNNTHFEFRKKFSKTQIVLFYAWGENYNYFNLSVELRGKNEKTSYEARQIFENGFGAVIEITP